MCKLKSGIILKNRVFVPEYDSHTDMLEELGIEDDYFNAGKTFVRVELSPENGDAFSDIDTWKLNVDQDIVPDRYDEEAYRPQVVEAVKKWAEGHIHNGVNGLRIDTGRNHYIKDCDNVIIYGNATVIGSPYADWYNKSSLTISDNATFKDNFTKIIHQSGDWKFVNKE